MLPWAWMWAPAGSVLAEFFNRGLELRLARHETDDLVAFLLCL